MPRQQLFVFFFSFYRSFDGIWCTSFYRHFLSFFFSSSFEMVFLIHSLWRRLKRLDYFLLNLMTNILWFCLWSDPFVSFSLSHSLPLNHFQYYRIRLYRLRHNYCDFKTKSNKVDDCLLFFFFVLFSFFTIFLFFWLCSVGLSFSQLRWWAGAEPSLKIAWASIIVCCQFHLGLLFLVPKMTMTMTATMFGLNDMKMYQ